MKISLIIPAYNEADGVNQTRDSLVPVLHELREHYTVELVFVDDGSIDNTQALLREAFGELPEMRIIPHDVNRNLGAALRTGFQNATGDVIVTTDFDGTYAFDLIPVLLTRFGELDTDILTASPYHPQGHVAGVPGYRLLFSFGASLAYRLLVNWDIHTWTALFRAYKREVVDTVTFDSDDFLAGTELLVNAIRRGYRVAEFPTTLHQRSFGQSSIKIARVTRAHMRFLLHILRLRLARKFAQRQQA
jgi:dolichol-phosphate mannosyltransferase